MDAAGLDLIVRNLGQLTVQQLGILVHRHLHQELAIVLLHLVGLTLRRFESLLHPHQTFKQFRILGL